MAGRSSPIGRSRSGGRRRRWGAGLCLEGWRRSRMTPARAGLGEAGCRAARGREAVYRRSRGGAIDSRPGGAGALGWRSAGKTAQGEGVGEGAGGSGGPVVDRALGPSPRLCGESVTGDLRSTTTPAPDPSPVVLRMLFVHSSTGLAIPAEVVVLCRFLRARSRPLPPLPQRRLPGRPPIKAADAQRPRAKSRQPRSPPSPPRRHRHPIHHKSDRPPVAPSSRHVSKDRK